MKKLMIKYANMVRFSWKREEGQSMVEYGLIIAGIAVVVAAALFILGPKVANMFTQVASNIPA